jgi:quinol monooxygenase YgiN
VEGRHVPLILFEFRVKAGREEEVERFLTNVLPSTRSYDGCLDLDVYRDTNDSMNFTIVQRWESVEHYERYRDWRIETGVFDDLVTNFVELPRMRYFELVGL